MTSTHSAFRGILFGQVSDGLPLQREELLYVVEIRRIVLTEEVGGVGALVLVQREAREGDGRPLLQQHVPDIVRSVVTAVRQALDDVALDLMGAERKGLRLRQGELAMGRASFTSSHRLARARRRLMVEPLRPVWAARSSRGRPSCISLANADASSRGVRFSRWMFSTVARRSRSSVERPERMSTGTA